MEQTHPVYPIIVMRNRTYERCDAGDMSLSRFLKSVTRGQRVNGITFALLRCKLPANSRQMFLFRLLVRGGLGECCCKRRALGFRDGPRRHGLQP